MVTDLQYEEGSHLAHADLVYRIAYKQRVKDAVVRTHNKGSIISQGFWISFRPLPRSDNHHISQSSPFATFSFKKSHLKRKKIQDTRYFKRTRPGSYPLSHKRSSRNTFISGNVSG